MRKEEGDRMPPTRGCKRGPPPGVGGAAAIEKGGEGRYRAKPPLEEYWSLVARVADRPARNRE